MPYKSRRQSGASSVSLNLRRQRLLQAFENRKLPPFSLSLKNSKKPEIRFGTRGSATWVGQQECGFLGKERGERIRQSTAQTHQWSRRYQEGQFSPCLRSSFLPTKKRQPVLICHSSNSISAPLRPYSPNPSAKYHDRGQIADKSA